MLNAPRLICTLGQRNGAPPEWLCQAPQLHSGWNWTKSQSVLHRNHWLWQQFQKPPFHTNRSLKVGFYDNTLLITTVRGSRLLKCASDIIADSPKLHVLALFFVCFIWHVYWHRNDGNFLVCHEGVIVGFDWGPPLRPCNGRLNTRVNRWSSVCQSQRTWLPRHRQDTLIVRGPVGQKQAPVFIVAWVTSNGWFLCTQNYRFSIHLALSACSLSSQTAEMPLFFCILKVSHLDTWHYLYVCVCDCRFWLLVGSRSTTVPTCCSRTRTASSTRWSSRQAELRPPRCCTQPNR